MTAVVPNPKDWHRIAKAALHRAGEELRRAQENAQKAAAALGGQVASPPTTDGMREPQGPAGSGS